jgi:hypothetical protein
MHRLDEKTGTRSCVGQSRHWNGTQIEAFLHPPAQIQQEDLKSEIFLLDTPCILSTLGKEKPPTTRRALRQP